MKDVSVVETSFIPPREAFEKLRGKPHFAWLDTCPGSTGGFSVMACEPFLVFSARKKEISIEEKGRKECFTGEPLEVLNELMKKNSVSCRHFFGPGVIGYFGYGLGRQIEKLPDISRDDISIPDIFLCFYDTLLVFDRRESKLLVISSCREGQKRMDPAFFSTRSGNSYVKYPSDCSGPRIDRVYCNTSRERYMESVKKVKEYIFEGDVYQVNLSRRIVAEGSFRADRLYLGMRSINPAPFSAFFDGGDFQIISNSPELFVKKQGSRLSTLPMKGTRPRGRTWKEDRLYRKELMESGKDMAELVMIVDLERNDMGKICMPGSIRVSRMRNLEAYKTVLQTTSRVEGRTRKDIGLPGILKALFPGGSITGAPKIRAMEIIEELEPFKRSFYTGSLGYLGFNGGMELNIMIRTILMQNNRLYYPVGGGIVWDSDPEDEYNETETKAKAFFLTLEQINEQHIPF